MQEKRVKSGIPGMDELISGGFINGSQILLTGTAGTGKTVFCSHFLYTGAKENEPGLYVSFEEPPENIKANMAKLGIDFEEFEKKKLIMFLRYDPYHIEDIFDLIESAIKKINAKRIVIDSISSLGLYIRDPSEMRRTILNLSILLRKSGITSILSSEIPSEQKTLSRFGVEEFVADTVIVLYYLRTESQFSRAITVWKMRGSEHSHKLHPYRITEKGIIIYPKEEAYIKI
ncbi:MAG: ATPase domain-containing protein [Candidatus Aenigmatarchaeota archaeon]|nr:AAA family ATPase [Candidatus Aenigmarchaeota archaeon]